SDSMQRQLLLSQMEALEDGQVGTWEMGMDRLLLGIAKTDEGLIPLSEVELFNQLLCILRALQQDLKPLFDGSERSIPDWIDFFAKLLSSYFNEEGGFLQELRYLREATAHLNKNRVCYEAIERILSSFFDKKQTRFQAPHLHGIQFRSIISGGIFPAKAIYLLGMQEGAFPRKNRFKLHAPEFHKTGDYRPTQTEEDRFLFLQLLLSAREKLFLSYQKISEEEQTFLRPSILIEELLPAFKIEEEPAHFTPTSATSPLLPELYLPLKMEAQKEDLNINLEQLASFAKHPLLYYLRQKLQMKIGSFEKNEEEEEFILSSLSKKKLREQALRMPLEQLLHEAEIKGALPRALFKKVALQTIKAEVENLEEHLNHFGVSKEQIQTEKIALKVVLSNQSVITLEGRLEGISPKGLLFYGENELSDLVKVWPLFLIYSIQRMPPTLLFTKTGESRTIALADPLLALQRYLEYYQLALNYGSPLIPKLAKPLLKGSIDELEKKLEELVSSSYSNDKTLKWLFDRDKLPIASAIFENWVALLKEVHDPL
ncbi:MAG TPA: hypothetical protein VLF61_02215, partial [Rhabdochlamydiaceae bacterium]|nr:hypothetical protein [Rhabdochlamydiaceae bacterium]